MKRINSVLIQSIVWISLLLIFVSSIDIEELRTYTMVFTTVKVGLYALSFNWVYYKLMPLYFKDKRQNFGVSIFLVLMLFVGINIFLDHNFHLKRKEILAKTQSIPSNKNNKFPWAFRLFPALFTGLAIFGTAASMKTLAEYDKKRASEEEANSKRLEGELQLLKSQINPHFLLNSLNNLYALSITEKQKAPEAIMKLSKLVSYILYDTAKDKVALSEDIDFINNYIELQKLRLGTNVKITSNMPSHIDQQIKIEPMVLITFIENAFKHGISTSEPCHIDIDLKLDDTTLQLVVKNNIFQKNSGIQGNPSGIGIINTIQRLDHTYSNAYTIDRKVKDDVYEVSLSINLK